MYTRAVGMMYTQCKVKRSGNADLSVNADQLMSAADRQHVGVAADALAASLRPAALGGSLSSALPIRAALQRLVKRGIAVNQATQTPPDEVTACAFVLSNSPGHLKR